MPLSNVSGSACGSGSCYFRRRPSRCQQKTNKKRSFLLITFCIIFKEKVKKKSQSSRNQGFSYYFCLVMEGSGPGSGSAPLTNGSGSGSRRPKNMWIRWIRIRICKTGTSTHIVGLDQRGQCILLSVVLTPPPPTRHGSVRRLYTCHLSTPN
jgi:hypothetical protein